LHHATATTWFYAVWREREPLAAHRRLAAGRRL